MGSLCSRIVGPKPFRGQKYLKIRNHYIKLGHNICFKDLKFPASDSILTFGHDIPRNIEWKRPTELCDNPNLLVGLLGQNAVRPGLLSQPWIVSAFSLLIARTELWHWVVPQYRVQCWGEEPASHPGVFHFRLWYRGEWMDVVVDDQLPTLNGKLVGAESTCSYEWWPALLEKAYAKLLGSYAALKSVELSDVLVDLTGGVSELWTLPTDSGSNGDVDDTFWPIFQRLKSELSHQSLITARVRPQAIEESTSDRTALGLELEQPYLVLSAKKLRLDSSMLKGILKGKEKIAMVRLCNPSISPQLPQSTIMVDAPEKSPEAVEGEAGTSSDFVFTHKRLTSMLSKVPEWSRLSDAEKQKMGLTVEDEREFWMPAEDFMTQFCELCVCRLLSGSGAPPLSCGTGDSLHWDETSLHSSWSGSTAAWGSGHSTPSQSLLRNPQFLLEVSGDKGIDVVVQLIQWSTKGSSENNIYPSIGCTVLKVEDNREQRLHSVLGHCPVVLNVGPLQRREINVKGHLPHGHYIVVPHSEHDVPASPQHLSSPPKHFLLRCFASGSSKLSPILHDVPPHPWWNCFSTDTDCITVVTVKSAEGLKHHARFYSCNPFCEIQCEGTKVCTPFLHDETDPIWDRSFVFYRKDPSEPLIVKVRSHRALLPSVVIGQTQLPAPVNHQPSIVRADLFLPGLEDEASRGVIILEVTTEDDLNAI